MKKLLLLASLALVPTLAWAHGPAQWIQNGGYHNAKGVHCCGPSDCTNIGQAELHRVEGGWSFQAEVNGEMMTLFAPDSSTFASQDANVWFCKSVYTADDKEVRCLFIPGSV